METLDPVSTALASTLVRQWHAAAHVSSPVLIVQMVLEVPVKRRSKNTNVSLSSHTPKI